MIRGSWPSCRPSTGIVGARGPTIGVSSRGEQSVASMADRPSNPIKAAEKGCTPNSATAQDFVGRRGFSAALVSSPVSRDSSNRGAPGSYDSRCWVGSLANCRESLANYPDLGMVQIRVALWLSSRPGSKPALFGRQYGRTSAPGQRDFPTRAPVAVGMPSGPRERGERPTPRGGSGSANWAPVCAKSARNGWDPSASRGQPRRLSTST